MARFKYPRFPPHGMAMHLAALHGSCLRVAVIVEEFMVIGTPSLVDPEWYTMPIA